MKRMTRITMAAVLLGTILFLGGCEGLKTQGRQIKFKTSTGEVGTKTYYGEDYNASGTTYQYIIWETGDSIRIVSDHAATAAGEYYADYVIDEVTGNSNHRSYATIAPTPNGLTWTGADSYKFYAVFPSPAVSGSAVTSFNYNSQYLGEVAAVLPSVVDLPASSGQKTVSGITYDIYPPDMKKAVMTAVATGVTENDSVSLVFKPAFTAFEFNISSAEDDLTVSKIVLSAPSDKIAGKYTVTAGALADVEPVGNAADTVTTKINKTLTSTAGITFTVFTIPKVNSGMVSIKVYTNQGTATLNLTDTDKSSAYKFQPGKKYRINMLKVGDRWKILFEVDVDEWIEATTQTTVLV